MAHVPILSGTPFFYFKGSCPLSHFHYAPFVVNGVKFEHVEKYLMFNKAVLFKDERQAKRILETKDPTVCKKLGRDVWHYEDAIWERRREDIALRGNIHKYQQNPGPAKFLLETEHRLLVEAAPHDRIWGAGFDVETIIHIPKARWGLNLHGKVQMQAREFMRSGWLPPSFKL